MPRSRQGLRPAASALAAVVVTLAAAGCARPSTVGAGSGAGAPSVVGAPSATGTQGQPTPSSTQQPSFAPSQLPTRLPSAAIRRALGCPADMGVAVTHRTTVAAAVPEVVVVVTHCASGAGSPPSGVYVLAAHAGTLAISATLVAAREQVQVDGLTIDGTTVRVGGSTYSGPDVPRCCPDVPYSRSWQVDGGHVRPAP